MKTTLNALVLAALLGAAMPSLAHYVEPKIQREPYGEQKVIYHLNEDNKHKFLAVLKNMLNQQAAVGKDWLTVAVVVHGGGLKLLQDAQALPDPADGGLPKDYQKTLRQRIDLLRRSGVRFLVCNETLKDRDLDWHSLYQVQEADIIPSGLAEVADLQQKGYIYLKP